MAVTDEKDGALATAAVAAAAGVGAYALRKALTSGSATSLVPGRNGQGDGEDDDDEGNGGSRGGSSLLSTVLDSASSSLLPLAEEAAEAAGKWTAENAPDVVRDRIVPRFIESFNDAA
jgi:hypothetical protein